MEEFKKILEGKTKACLFTHPFPDPDAIGSMMGMSWVLDKLGIKSNMYYDGVISHPQNKSMVNLLDLELIPLSNYDSDLYDQSTTLNILLDTVPDNAGAPNEVSFDMVIDHHKDFPLDYKGVYLNLKSGSACSVVYNLIEQLELEFEEDKLADNKVATAMMIGITTDTEFLMSDDCSDHEFFAWSKLFQFRDPTLLKQIVHYERPKFWIDSKATACAKAIVDESVGVVGMGLIPQKHRDMIADMADEMVTWEDLHTAIVFALVDGSRIEGCVRTKASSVSAPSLCNELAGKYGLGGGKLGKGAYKYELCGAGIEEDDDEDIKLKTWDLFQDKEIRRVFRIVKNN